LGPEAQRSIFKAQKDSVLALWNIQGYKAILPLRANWNRLAVNVSPPAWVVVGVKEEGDSFIRSHFHLFRTPSMPKRDNLPPAPYDFGFAKGLPFKVLLYQWRFAREFFGPSSHPPHVRVIKLKIYNSYRLFHPAGNFGMLGQGVVKACNQGQQ